MSEIYLTGILLPRLRVAGAHHVVGDHLGVVVGVAAVLIADDRQLHLLQQARGRAVLLQRAPPANCTHGANVQAI